MNNVKNDENISPQTIAVATGAQISEWPPNPIARENKPATVVSVVIIMGKTLRLAAYVTAALNPPLFAAEYRPQIAF